MRKFTADDARAAFRNWTCDPEVTRYMTWFAHKSVQETEAVISQWLVRYSNPDYFQWAIVLKELGEPIGSIGIVDCDPHSRTGDIGYCIGRAFWHCGYMSEALGAVIDYLLRPQRFHTLTARHDIRNPNSGAVMAKCGMRYVETREQVGLTKEGEPLTCCYYEITCK